MSQGQEKRHSLLLCCLFCVIFDRTQDELLKKYWFFADIVNRCVQLVTMKHGAQDEYGVDLGTFPQPNYRLYAIYWPYRRLLPGLVSGRLSLWRLLWRPVLGSGALVWGTVYLRAQYAYSGAAAHFTHILIGWKVGEVYDLWAENISDYQTLDFPVQDNGEEDEEDDE